MRLSGMFRKERTEQEISEEIGAHLDLHIRDNLEAGMPPAEARRRANITLGGVEATKEGWRD
jgi:hypothetical protein